MGAVDPSGSPHTCTEVLCPLKISQDPYELLTPVSSCKMEIGFLHPYNMQFSMDTLIIRGSIELLMLLRIYRAEWIEKTPQNIVSLLPSLWSKIDCYVVGGLE